jgi:hypothetical protein
MVSAEHGQGTVAVLAPAVCMCPLVPEHEGKGKGGP